MSCAHRNVLDGSLAKIAQVDTRATVRDAHEYNNSRISRLVTRDRSSPMSALLDRFDAAEIFALASVDAIFVEDARNQLQSHRNQRDDRRTRPALHRLDNG